MKKLFLLLMFPLISIAQDTNSNINLNQTIGFAKTEGLVYMGNGVYRISKISRFFKGKRGLEKDIREQIIELSNRQNLEYEIINIENSTTRSLDPKVEISFKLKTKEGDNFLSKSEAKKQIIELKELLDLGVLDEEEFNTKIIPLKKMILNN